MGAIQSGAGLAGAILAIFLGNGFESFLYWFAFFISGFFLLTHVTNLTQTLESKVPAIAKIHLFYLAAWCVMLALDVIYRFVVWNLISIFSWVLLVAFFLDLFFKYRSSKAGTAGPPPATPATVESGGKF